MTFKNIQSILQRNQLNNYEGNTLYKIIEETIKNTLYKNDKKNTWQYCRVFTYDIKKRHVIITTSTKAAASELRYLSNTILLELQNKEILIRNIIIR